MKLRNKKTGKIINGCFVVCEYKDSARFSVKDKPVFDSLSELNEDWEDYKPTEPLIKDKRIRKAVRAWAEVNYIHDVNFKDDGVSTFIGGDYEQISFNPWRQSGLEEGKLYTIEELCGEKE